MDAEILIYISNLIKKNISGEITENERVILNEWINESPKNKKLYEKYSQPSFFLSINRENDLAEAQIAYKEFKNSLPQRPKLRALLVNRYTAAASFLAVVVSAAFFFLWFSNKQISSNVFNRVAVKSISTHQSSESADMLLISADGKELPISNTQKIMTVSDHSIQIGGQSILLNKSNEATTYNTLKILRGKRFKMQLSDGTVVWLNADSEITFPNKFDGDSRQVKVKGELFFEVTENRKKPFIVETPKGNIQVLGTSFNVRCYNDESPATTLVRGKIEYTLGSQSVILKPGQQCVVKNNDLKVSTVDTYEYVSWINEIIVFRNKKLEQIMNTLSRLYDVQITYDDERLKGLPFTGAFKQYEHLEDVIQMIEDCGLIRIDKDGNKLVIHKRSNTLLD